MVGGAVLLKASELPKGIYNYDFYFKIRAVFCHRRKDKNPQLQFKDQELPKGPHRSSKPVSLSVSYSTTLEAPDSISDHQGIYSLCPQQRYIKKKSTALQRGDAVERSPGLELHRPEFDSRRLSLTLCDFQSNCLLPLRLVLFLVLVLCFCFCFPSGKWAWIRKA